jgi:hypothetical protein
MRSFVLVNEISYFFLNPGMKILEYLDLFSGQRNSKVVAVTLLLVIVTRSNGMMMRAGLDSWSRSNQSLRSICVIVPRNLWDHTYSCYVSQDCSRIGNVVRSRNQIKQSSQSYYQIPASRVPYADFLQ